MDRRTKICLWVILLGLANFLLYAIIYVHLGGEAVTGRVGPDGTCYLHPGTGQPVPRWVFIYSGIHSISIWPTVGATWLAWLTLAKDRIISSMRSSIVRGRMFITVLATIIALATAILTIWFTLQFLTHLAGSPPGSASPATRPAVTSSADAR
jgi:hypothetical protein